MRIMQRTGKNYRSVLRLNRSGVLATWERPKIGGGWYIDNLVTVPWPWRRDY